MASLSNINGIFDVHSTGAIQFNGNHGTAGQILKSNGNAAPTWIPQSDIVGAYLPLAGGTLTGATATASGISFTVGGFLTLQGSGTNTTTFDTTNTQLIIKNSAYTTASGLALRSSNNTWQMQLYASGGGTDYGFLQSEWGAWNMRKNNSGGLYLNNNTTYFVQPESTSNMNAANFAGSLNISSNLLVTGSAYQPASGGGYIGKPYGGDFYTTQNVYTGAIQVTLPTGGTGLDDMLKFVIDIFDYATQEAVTVFVGGYTYQNVGSGNNTWTNVQAQVIGQSANQNYTVRFGDNGTSHCVWVGDTNSSWNHLQVIVRDFFVGYGANINNWIGAWDINVVTTQTTVNNTLTNNFPMSSGDIGGPYLPLTGGTLSGNITVNARGFFNSAASYPLATSSGQRYNIQIRNTNNTVNSGYGWWWGTDTNFNMFFHADGASDKMTLTRLGELGVNFTAPGGYGQLTVSGTSALPILALRSGSGKVRQTFYEGGTGRFHFDTLNGSDGLAFVDGDGVTEVMRVDYTGNVGVNDTTPDYALTVGKRSNAAPAFMVSGAYYGGPRIQTYGLDADSNAWMGLGTDMSGAPYEHNIYFSDHNGMGRLSMGTYNGTTYSEKMCVLRTGNVGIGTTNPTNYKLEVNGNVKGDSFGTDQNTTARIFAPSGAAYNGSGTQTGYLIMQLPDNGAGGVNNMMSGVIRVFDYTSGESFDVHFYGYWYSGYNWTNCTAFVINQPGVERNFNVRFGAFTGSAGANTRPYIAIGEATSTWSYCKFSVIEYTSGHSNMNLYKWNSGWGASLSATLPGPALRTVTNTQTNNWKRSGSNMYNANSGNVGIGTISPVSKLEVNGSIKATGITANIGSDPGVSLSYDTSNNIGLIETWSSKPLLTRTYNYQAFSIGTNEKMRITSTGIGIGNTSPGALLDVGATIHPNTTGIDVTGVNCIGLNTVDNHNWLPYTDGNNYYSATKHQFRGGTNNSPNYMMLDSTGLGIGNTSPQTTLHTGPTTTVTNVFTARFAASNFFASGGNSIFYVPDTAANIMMFGSNQFGTNQIEFYHKNPGTSQAYVGRISTSGSATSYVTSSDYRLKENIVPISDSISRLNQLKPSRFNFIEEPGKVVDGFIAHEVQDIVPEAIVGEKDEVDKDGGIVPQGIDQAKLVPLLVAAIQELEARVKELENK